MLTGKFLHVGAARWGFQSPSNTWNKNPNPNKFMRRCLSRNKMERRAEKSKLWLPLIIMENVRSLADKMTKH